MPSYKVHFIHVAEKDLNSIIDYVLADNPLHALSLMEKFSEAIDRLVDFPLMDSIPRDPEIEQLITASWL